MKTKNKNQKVKNTTTSSRSSRSCKNKLTTAAFIFLLMLAVIFSLTTAGFVLADNSSNSTNDSTAPVIVAKGPSGLINDNPVMLTVTTDEISTCRYDGGDVPYADMDTSFDQNDTYHSDAVYLTDGSHVYYARCMDEFYNEGSSVQISFTLDTTPPTLSNLQPVGTINNDRATLEVTSNEIAECRFNTADSDFDSMNTFSQTNSLNHQHEITGLEEGDKIYYVRCKDSAGNKMLYSEQIAFSINRPPTARVSIDGGSPLKADTYEVTLTTSETMQDIPSLKYNFNDDAGMKTVSLTGSGTRFEGYMIIKENTADKVGTFYFSGKDLTGLSGDEITNGKLFLVDTTSPAAPKDFRVEYSDDDIKLEWYYQGEDANTFRIYRSEISEVNYVDYYDSTKDREYYDKNADPGITYFYKVSAVDKAGNEGPLTKQEKILTIPDDEPEVINEKDPVVSYKIKARLNLLEADLIDIESSISRLETATEQEELEIMNNLDLVAEAKNMKESFAGLITQLEKLQDTDIKEHELDKTIQKIDQNAQKYKQSIVEEVVIQEKTSYAQAVGETDIGLAVKEYLLDQTLSDKEREEYKQQVWELSDQIDISVSLITAKLKYLDKSELEDKTLVKKQVIPKEPIEDISIVEIIPKEVARHSDEILFKEPPVILKKDPIVKWDYSYVSDKEIVYIFDELKDLNVLQKAKTVVLPQLTGESEDNSSITGSVVKEEPPKEFKFDFNYIMIIVGIMVIAGLAVYYFFFLRIEDDFEQKAVGVKGSSRSSKRKIIDDKGNKFTGFFSRLYNKLTAAGKVKSKEPSGSTSEIITTLLRKGNENINSLNFKHAHTYYLEALDIMNAAGPNVRAHMNKEVESLYYKIALCKKIQEAHTYVDNKHSNELNQSIKNITALLDLVMENSDLESNEDLPLLKFGVNSRDYFSDALKSMKPTSWNYRNGLFS